MNTVEKVYKWREDVEARDQKERPYLGASIIGTDCSRALWMGFRWVLPTTQQKFPGRILRLFDRGHREEPVFVEELEGIGCQVEGQQEEAIFLNGHGAAHCDAIIKGFPEYPKEWVLTDFKTMGEKSFKKFKKIVENSSNPDGDFFAEYPNYHGQLHVQMKLFGLSRAALFAVNKNTDELAILFLESGEDYAAANWYIDRAETLIGMGTPPPVERVATDFRCRFCDVADQCFKAACPAVNCRTCVFLQPKAEGVWRCKKHGDKQRAIWEQREGCFDHVFITDLLPWDYLDATESAITYDTPSGDVVNGAGGLNSYQLLDHFHEIQQGEYVPNKADTGFLSVVVGDRKSQLLALIADGNEEAKADYFKEFGDEEEPDA